MAKNRTRTFELHIKQEIANSVPDFLFGSEILLRNVLAELVDNSIRHRVNGKIVVRAEHLQDGKSAIRFSVINLGSQVSEGELARLKDLSQAQKSEWNSVGEGLGLVIIHKVLKRFSSQLSVEVVSSDELVISFVVDAEYLRAAREPDRLMLGVSNLLRVLVVDDESITRQVFGAYLKRLNASVDFAINGKEAVVKAKSRPYDAIFMDLSMPILNGFVAARVILQMDSPYPKPKIIAISSHCRQVDRDRCQGIGIFKLLEKPVRLDDLREALDQIQVRSSEDPLLVDWNTSTKK